MKVERDKDVGSIWTYLNWNFDAGVCGDEPMAVCDHTCDGCDLCEKIQAAEVWMS